MPENIHVGVTKAGNANSHRGRCSRKSLVREHGVGSNQPHFESLVSMASNEAIASDDASHKNKILAIQTTTFLARWFNIPLFVHEVELPVHRAPRSSRTF